MIDGLEIDNCPFNGFAAGFTDSDSLKAEIFHFSGVCKKGVRPFGPSLPQESGWRAENCAHPENYHPPIVPRSPNLDWRDHTWFSSRRGQNQLANPLGR